MDTVAALGGWGFTFLPDPAPRPPGACIVFTNVFTLVSRRQGRTHEEKHMETMDDFHSQILEAHWCGLNACEIAHELAADPVIVARIIDDFDALGY